MSNKNSNEKVLDVDSVEGAVLKVMASVIKVLSNTDVVEQIFNCVSIAHVFSDENNHYENIGVNKDNGDGYLGVEEGMAVSMLGVAIAFIGYNISENNGADSEVIETDNEKRLRILKKAFDGKDPNSSFCCANELLGIVYGIRSLSKLLEEKGSDLMH